MYLAHHELESETFFCHCCCYEIQYNNNDNYYYHCCHYYHFYADAEVGVGTLTLATLF